MAVRPRRRDRPHRIAVGAFVTALTFAASAAMGQAPPLPEPSPGASEAVTPREAELEARVQQLEAMVQQLSRQMQGMQAAPASESEPGAEAEPPESALPGSAPTMGGPPITAEEIADEEMERGGAVGLDPTSPTPSSRYNMPPPPRERRGTFTFGNGFELKSEDDEYVFQFHGLIHVDGRFYESPGTDVARNTFGLPRAWLVFNGRLTRPLEYYIALNEGFENLNLLDAFLNIRPRDEVQFKIGRFKTPFTYEFYSLPVQGLISPERSMFFNNFGLNRDVGLMAWGQLFDKRLEYATGIFNSNRSSFLNDTNGFALASLVDARPLAFLGSEAFENFHLGGSVLITPQLNDPTPSIMRTNIPTVGPLEVSVPFLHFKPDVIASGGTALWDLHAAWYYNQLSLIAEWQSGYETYAFRASPEGSRTPIPVSSYYVQAGYFLTGETVQTRNSVEPKRPFGFKPGQRGPGAWELAARYNMLSLSDRVFTAGFVDPALWTNRVQLVDLGVNWSLTRNLKFYFGWEHAMFANPVMLRSSPLQLQLTSDMFWFRTQVVF